MSATEQSRFTQARDQLEDAERFLEDLARVLKTYRASVPMRETRKALLGGIQIAMSAAEPDPVTLDVFNRLPTFAKAVRDALGTALAGVVEANLGFLSGSELDAVQMPLCRIAEEFEAQMMEGGVGLRPDQVTLLRTLQPFTEDPEVGAWIGQHMLFLLNAAEMDDNQLPVALWQERRFQPTGFLTSGEEIAGHSLGDGREEFGGEWPVAEFCVPAGAALERHQTGIRLGLIANCMPWPTDERGYLIPRCETALVIAREVINMLEESRWAVPALSGAGVREGFRQVQADPAWVPIHFETQEDEQEVRETLRTAGARLGTRRDEDGGLLLVRLEGDDLVGREVPEARIDPGPGDFGPAVEAAALGAAARWGLPDFVFLPITVRKGAAQREIGDGTLISGSRGITLQVKARETPSDDEARETAWLDKKAHEGARQAAGTLRQCLQQQGVELTNLRGRVVRPDWASISWIAVVILDHPAKHAPIVLDSWPEPRTVVLLRRDWEFIWDQLRSASAVVDYLHRVSADESGNLLGDEAARYTDLAQADLDNHRGRDELDRTAPAAGEWISYPAIPLESPAAVDVIGHAFFRNMLNDIAETDFTGEESMRLEIMSILDRVPVAERANLGRLLLERLDKCLLAEPDVTRAEHRTLLLEGGRIHLVFSTMSHLTGFHHNLYQQWLLLRRLEYLEANGWDEGQELPWTVGVLLTPTLGGKRYWDTTVLATNLYPDMPDEVRENLEVHLNATVQA